MKILKIFGIVAGVHAFALLMIFANPGCSSSKAQASASSAGKSDAPAPVSAAPDGAAPAPVSAAPTEASTPPPQILYSPTRPGTPAAAALEVQPVANVTPATTYTVVSHDTLSVVAKKNHLKTAELAAANHLRPGSPLHVGQKLIIPSKAGAAPAPGPSAAAAAPSGPAASAAATPAAPAADGKPSGETVKHTVKAGETLGRIAHIYHVRVGDIATANNISDPQKIRPGQELIIPVGAGKGAVTGAKAPKAAKAKAAGPDAGAASAPMEASPPPSAAPAAPASGPDTAPKPDASSSDIPVIKIDDNPPAAAPKP